MNRGAIEVPSKTRYENPRLIARMAGLFYLLTGGTAFAFFTRGRLFTGDAATTKSNILVHESMYRVAVVADLLGVASYLVVIALLYRLFKPVNTSASVLAVFFGLLGCVIQAGACCFDLVALTTAHLATSVDYVYATVQLLTRLHAQAFNIAILFFGLYCLVIGYVASRSTFFPRILGVLMAVGGLAYVVNEIVVFYSTPPVALTSSFAMILGGLGELLFLLWLLAFGVNEAQWQKQADSSD